MAAFLLNPTKKGFEKLLGKPLTYIETYLASEGFLAFQALPGRKSMRLVLNNGVFYEFVPFNEENFDDEGLIRPTAQAYKIDQVQEGLDLRLAHIHLCRRLEIFDRGYRAVCFQRGE